LEKDVHPISRNAPFEETPSKTFRTKRFGATFILSFVILFILWIIFSGRFDGFHITLGLISSAIVAAFSGDLMFTSRESRGIFKRILCEGRAQDIDTTTLISNLSSEKFQKAKHGLRQFIENYESRIFIFHIQKIAGYKSASYEMISV
jgi:hypothetical protein